MLYIPLDFSILAYSLALTLLVDAIDHTLSILFIVNPLTKEIKSMIREGNIKGAVSRYYRGRFGAFEYFYLHNLIVLAVIFMAAVYLKSMVLLLGLAFHFVCDIFEGYQKGSLEFWAQGWSKLIKIH